jgi:hypothetical protein
MKILPRVVDEILDKGSGHMARIRANYSSEAPPETCCNWINQLGRHVSPCMAVKMFAKGPLYDHKSNSLINFTVHNGIDI